MRYLPLLFLVVSVQFAACKNKSTIQPATTNPTDTIKVTTKPDVRWQYEGMYEVLVKYYSNAQGTIINNSYTCTMQVNYMNTDSIVYAVDASKNYFYKQPVLNFHNTSTNKLYKKLGADSVGRIYIQKDGWYSIMNGGFIGKDSIACYFGYTGPDSTTTDTLTGYRIK